LRSITTIRYIVSLTTKNFTMKLDIGCGVKHLELSCLPTIPRGLSLVAGGRHNGQPDNDGADNDGAIVLEVKAQAEGSEWGIVESPFMRD
jgi:hypothetical protein